MWDLKTRDKLEAHVEKMFTKKKGGTKRKKPGRRATGARSLSKSYLTHIFESSWHS